MELKEQISRLFPRKIREALYSCGLNFEKLCAIRIRAEKPLIFCMEDGELFLNQQNRLTDNITEAICISAEDIREIMGFVSNHSMYAFDEELKQGYITISGGHRIGIVGNTILEQGRLSGVRYISCINVRIAHQIRGCGSQCLPYLYEQGSLQNTLIVSGCSRGKTTILRDLIRQISNGTAQHAGVTVGVVDERSEIAASCKGVPQNDIGLRTDILDGCPKALGMMLLIRSMAPAVIAVDELGEQEDLEAVRAALSCGSRLLATIHASTYQELRSRPLMEKLLGEHRITRLIFLRAEGPPGRIKKICDGEGGEIALC
jgi:stage III sporulation protein AA